MSHYFDKHIKHAKKEHRCVRNPQHLILKGNPYSIRVHCEYGKILNLKYCRSCYYQITDPEL